MALGAHTSPARGIQFLRFYGWLLVLGGCHAISIAGTLRAHGFGLDRARWTPHACCFITSHLQTWGPHPAARPSLSKACGRIPNGQARCNAQPPGTGGSVSQQQSPELHGKELDLKDLASNKWLAHQLHEYVQAKEAEKRRRAYLLPRKKRLPLQNFHEETTVIGKVVSLLPFGCRVDVGCLDTLGLLHVRDMHFLPEALKAGEKFLRGESEVSGEASAEVEPVASPGVGPQSSPEGPEASPQAVSGWIQNVSDVLKVGDILSLSIKSIDRGSRRMRLTTVAAREAQAESPRKAVEAFWVGQEVEGTVLRSTDFGLFLDIGAVEDAFLHANELGRDNADEEPYDLYRRFKDSRKSRRSSFSSSSPVSPPSRVGDKAGGGGRYEALHCRSGDKLAGLRVLDIDAARGRIQLTTRTEEEVRRLQQWKRRSLGMQEDAVGAQQKEPHEEKIAKIRTALKLLERHRKKQQASAPRPQDSQCPPQAKPSGSSTDRVFAALFPGYSDQDIEEALALLESEKRRKELLVLQEAERRARKRHPRFLRRSADDLTEQEAWQLLKKEEPGTLTPDILMEDARKQAVRAGLSIADVPVFGPDGMPRVQQVPLKDLIPKSAAPETPGRSSGPASPPERPRETGNLATPSPAEAERRGSGGGPPSADAPTARLPDQTDASGGNKSSPGEADALLDDLVIPPMKLQQELMAYENQQTSDQQPSADVRLHSPNTPPTNEHQQTQRSTRGSTAGAARHADGQPNGFGVTASDVDAFFAKSEAALLASLRKGRGKRDSAFTAIQEEEVQDLIRQDREMALKNIAGATSGARGDTTADARSVASTIEEEREESLGDVSHSEVLQTIKERLRDEPELVQEVQRLGESPEALARKVQAILQHVTNLAALLTADIAEDPTRQRKTSGRRRREGPSPSVEEGRVEERATDSDESDKGFVSPLFQLTDDAQDTNVSSGPDSWTDVNHEAAETDDGGLSNIHSYLMSTAGRARRRADKTSRKGKRLSSPDEVAAVLQDASGSGLDLSLPRDAVRCSPDQLGAGELSDAFPHVPTKPSARPPATKEMPQGYSDDASATTGADPHEAPSSQTLASKYLDDALSRARQEAALAANFRVRRGAGSRVQQQRDKRSVVSVAAFRETKLRESQGFSNPAASLDAPDIHRETETAVGKVGETLGSPAKQKRRSKPDILILPSGGTNEGMSPEGTGLRPVRSLAELRKLQRQHSQAETRPHEPPAGKRGKAPSPEGKAPASQHRQLLNVVRRLHEQRGTP